MAMTRQKALEVLDLQHAVTPLTADIINAAFKRAIRFGHPDSPDYKADLHIHNMSVYQEARKKLLEEPNIADSYCKLCNGLGMVRTGGWVGKCSACKGTGDRQ